MTVKTFPLKITSAVALGGVIHKAGSIVPEVEERVARDLLRRGKAVLHTVDEDAASEDIDTDTGGILYGSGTMPAVLTIAGQKVQLGTLVAAAHAASGLSVDDWNALDEPARDHLLAEQIKVLEDIAAATKPTTPPARKQAARQAAK